MAECPAIQRFVKFRIKTYGNIILMVSVLIDEFSLAWAWFGVYNTVMNSCLQHGIIFSKLLLVHQLSLMASAKCH
jgi:hypothetical protein